MRDMALSMLVLISQYFCVPVHAYELKHSGRTEIWDNPFLAYGYNPKTRITTGYLAALRTAPGRTDECKLVFAESAEKANQFFVRYIGGKASSAQANRRNGYASLTTEDNTSYLRFSKKNLGGDCDWILPFVVESDLSESSGEVMVEMEVQHAGDWISVYAIGAQKARFYSRPDSSSAQKEFLVKGDVIYVYDEKADWYFVKYEEGKKRTEGWIRKSDTLQP